MTRLASSFESLASLGSFDVLGARPFAGISGQFAEVASQSRTLSTDLGDAAAAMEANITDSAAVAADLRVLAAQLEELEASLGGGREGETPKRLPPRSRSMPLGSCWWACCCGWRFRRSPRSGSAGMVPGRPGLIRPHLVSPRLSRTSRGHPSARLTIRVLGLSEGRRRSLRS